MSKDANYSEDEVRAIIDRALRTDLGRQVSHEELVAVAGEVGISRDAIEVAAREIRATRQLEEVKQRVVKRRRRNLASHAFAFAIVNTFLFVINFLTTPGEWWFLFALLGWGLGLLFHARAGLSKEVTEREIRREHKRLTAERRLLEGDLPSLRAGNGGAQAAQEFSAAVQDRVGRILSKAAAEIRGADAARRPVRVDPGPEEVEAPSVDDSRERGRTSRV